MATPGAPTQFESPSLHARHAEGQAGRSVSTSAALRFAPESTTFPPWLIVSVLLASTGASLTGVHVHGHGCAGGIEVHPAVQCPPSSCTWKVKLA